MWLGMLTLRGLDLRLAFGVAPTASTLLPKLDPRLWLAALCLLLFCICAFNAGKRLLPQDKRERVGKWLGPASALLLPLVLFAPGLSSQLGALRLTLESCLLMVGIYTWWSHSGQSETSSGGPALRWPLMVAMGAQLTLHLAEHALARPLVGVGVYAGLHAALLLGLLVELGRYGLRAGSIEEKATALCLTLPLLFRLAGVGSWTALLGVALPEAMTGYALALWSLCGLALCALTFPRGKGPSWIVFGTSCILVTALIFLLYFHYLHRFGDLEPLFDTLSESLLGLRLPYPQWHSPAASAAFAVSCVFVAGLLLRTLSSPEQRKRGVGLALWFAAGLGLHQAADLVCLLCAVQALRMQQEALTLKAEPAL